MSSTFRAQLLDEDDRRLAKVAPLGAALAACVLASTPAPEEALGAEADAARGHAASLVRALPAIHCGRLVLGGGWSPLVVGGTPSRSPPDLGTIVHTWSTPATPATEAPWAAPHPAARVALNQMRAISASNTRSDGMQGAHLGCGGGGGHVGGVEEAVDGVACEAGSWEHGSHGARECYRQWTGAFGRPPARVTLTLRLQHGQARAVAVTYTSAHDPVLEACLARAASGWSLVGGEDEVVEQSFVLDMR